jgi:predicted nucleic acid-binding protein
MICLDSSFLIDILKGKKEALAKAAEIKEEDSFTTSICEYEIMVGAYLGDYSKEKIEKAVSLLNGIPVHNFDSNSALTASSIHAELVKTGKEIEEKDCMIAGTALSNGCKTILTKNIEHFKRIKELKVISY